MFLRSTVKRDCGGKSVIPRIANSKHTLSSTHNLTMSSHTELSRTFASINTDSKSSPLIRLTEKAPFYFEEENVHYPIFVSHGSTQKGPEAQSDCTRMVPLQNPP